MVWELGKIPASCIPFGSNILLLFFSLGYFESLHMISLTLTLSITFPADIFLIIIMIKSTKRYSCCLAPSALK